MSSTKSKLRACMLCSFVQAAPHFKRDGCPNCDELLKMRGSAERVLECTSGIFDGVVAVMNPQESWVAKWQRINRYRPGLYAIRINGVLPEHIQNELEHEGIPASARQRDDD